MDIDLDYILVQQNGATRHANDTIDLLRRKVNLKILWC